MVNDYRMVVSFNMFTTTPMHYLSANNMGDIHEVIVNHVRKMIGRISVTFHQHRVIDLLVRKFDLSMNFILNNGFSLRDLYSLACEVEIRALPVTRYQDRNQRWS